jgi:hypothetical protein
VAVVRREELLGTSERYDSDLAPIDYDSWPFYSALTEARRSGQLRAYCLGLGVDPLSLAADLLTVVVVDAEPFDELFGGLVEVNEEGSIVSQAASQGASQQAGLPLNEATVRRFIHAEPMQAAGAALINLAWQFRPVLLG